jgi:hypothetical protein
MIIITILLVLFFYLGVEAGASWPWSDKWQTNKFKKKLPELALAGLIAGLSLVMWGVDGAYGLAILIASFVVALAGIEAATWSFIQWTTKHKDATTGRTFSLQPIVDWLAFRIGGWRLGDEGYSWTAATVKGTIICLPVATVFAPIGGLLFAFGYEIGSHFKGRVTKFNPHIVSEGMSFMLLGAFCIGIFAVTRNILG